MYVHIYTRTFLIAIDRRVVSREERKKNLEIVDSSSIDKNSS